MNTSRRIASVVAVAALLGGGAWYLSGGKGPSSAANLGSPSAVGSADLAPAPGFVTATSSRDAPASGSLKPPRKAPAGSLEYRSEQYRFALFYPDGLSVKEYDEGGGAATLVFQNTQEVKGFQIFVAPYSASQVSVARFKQDEPSGTMQNPMPLFIDGVLTTTFVGSNPALGRAREVWFIHGGYLFEVTTPELLDTWLSAVMQTWQFI